MLETKLDYDKDEGGPFGDFRPSWYSAPHADYKNNFYGFKSIILMRAGKEMYRLTCSQAQELATSIFNSLGRIHGWEDENRRWKMGEHS